MSSHTKQNEDQRPTDSSNGDKSVINRRNVLLGSSSLVAATALTSEALAQAQKATPVQAPADCGRAQAQHPRHLRR